MKLRNIKQQYRVNWASVPLGRDLGLGRRASWAVHEWCMGAWYPCMALCLVLGGCFNYLSVELHDTAALT